MKQLLLLIAFFTLLNSALADEPELTLNCESTYYLDKTNNTATQALQAKGPASTAPLDKSGAAQAFGADSYISYVVRVSKSAAAMITLQSKGRSDIESRGGISTKTPVSLLQDVSGLGWKTSEGVNITHVNVGCILIKK